MADMAALQTDMAALQRWLDADPVRGRDAIVKAWLEHPDQPGTWNCQYKALAVTGEVGVSQGQQ